MQYPAHKTEVNLSLRHIEFTLRETMDVTTADFETKVIRESENRPVLVDFWAPWCGPCRTLTPALEALEKEYGGKFLLAKVNTDAEPQLGQAFRIMSIPDVKVFHKGKVAGGFVGAQPAERIREVIEQFIVPEDFLALQNLALSSPDAALAKLAESKFNEKRKHEAAWAIARGFISQAKPDTQQLQATLNHIPEFGSPFSEQRTAMLHLIEQNVSAAEIHALVFADEKATAAFLDAQLAAIENNENKTRAKELMVKAFHLLGNENPLTLDYRRKLSRVLF